MTISTLQLLAYPDAAVCPPNLIGIMENENLKNLIQSHKHEIADLEEALKHISEIKSPRISTFLMNNIITQGGVDSFKGELNQPKRNETISKRIVNKLHVNYWDTLVRAVKVEKLLTNANIDTNQYLLELVNGNPSFNQENIQKLFSDIESKLSLEKMVEDIERHRKQININYLKNGKVEISAIYQRSEYHNKGVDAALKLWALALIKATKQNWLQAVSEINLDKLPKANDLDIQFNDVIKQHCYTLKLDSDLAKLFRKLVPESE